MAINTLDKILASDEHLQWAEKVLEQSMTLVKDTSQILPLNPEKIIRIVLD